MVQCLVNLLLGLWSLLIIVLSSRPRSPLVSAGASGVLDSRSGATVVTEPAKVSYYITVSPSGTFYARTLSPKTMAAGFTYVIKTSLPRSGVFPLGKAATSLVRDTNNGVSSSGILPSNKPASTLAESTNTFPEKIVTPTPKSRTFPSNTPASSLGRGTNKSPDNVVTSVTKSGNFLAKNPATPLSMSMSTPSFTASGFRTLSTPEPVETTAVVEDAPSRPTPRENDTRMGADTDHILNLISYFGVGISIVALFLVFLTFLCLRIKKTEHHFIHANFALSLIFAQVLFLFGVQRREYQIACRVIAMALHYLFLVAFCWIALEGVMLYFVLIKVFQTNIRLRRRKTVFFLCGWGVPGMLVGVTATFFYEEYGTDDFCWLSVHSNVIWALVGPVLLVCLFNCACLVKTFCVMAERRRLNQNQDRVAEIRFWAKGCALLSCLLGITWMLGVFVVNETTPFMVYVFNVFNTLQGLLIFTVHCLGDEKIRSEYVSIFHCGKKRAAYGLVRQRSKTDLTNKKEARTFTKEQETIETKAKAETPQDTQENGHLATCRRSLGGLTDRRASGASGNCERASTASGDHKRVSQEMGSSNSQSREWACSWIHVDEEPEGSFAMDVFSSLEGGGCRDLHTVESDNTYDQQVGFPLTQNGFKSFKVECVKKQEEASQGRDSRILKLYEDEKYTVEAVSNS